MDNFSFVPFPLASLPPSGLLLVAGPTCIEIYTFALVSFQQLPILMFSISLSISAKIHKIKCQSDLFLPWEVTLKVQLSGAQALFSLFPAHLCSNSNVEILVGPLCLLPGTRGQHRSHNKIHPTQRLPPPPITEQVLTMTRTSQSCNSYCGHAQILTSPRLRLANIICIIILPILIIEDH